MQPNNNICTTCGTSIPPFYLSFLDKWHFPECPVCAPRKRTEAEHREILAEIEKQRAIIDNILMAHGVSQRHIRARLNDFGPTYRELPLGDQGAYVYGPRGVGKTHLVSAIMRAMIEEHLHAAQTTGSRPRFVDYPRMVSTSDLLREIRSTFGGRGQESESNIIERYASYTVLMLDDLGTEQATDWTLATLYSIVDQRYRDMRRTFVTSNLSLKDLAAQTSDRITSRLAEMCRVVRLNGPDRRVTKKGL